MTNEEAIAIIENEKKCVNRANKNDYCNRDCYNCELVKTDTEILTALDTAIQALSQQPCEDVVSRKDIQDYIAKYLSQYLYEDVRQAVEAIDTYIGDMPSVTQKSETVTEFADRCRECGKMRKGHWIWNFDKGYCKCSECGIGMGHKEFDYCPNCGAKMQESEE